MYLKLALKNMKRSIRDYTAYFITIIIAVTLMYSFLALSCSPDILMLSDTMSAFKGGITLLTVLAVVLISFVTGYAADFIINRRKQEFSVYKILGMEAKSINRMFYVENLFLFLTAMVLGIIFGSFLSGILSDYVMRIFDTPHEYSIAISKAPVLYTLFFCCLMQTITVVRIIRNINHKKIADLMYETQKKENPVISHSLRYKIIFVFAWISLAVGVFLIWYGLTCNTMLSWLYLFAAFVCVIFGIYRIYRFFPVLLTVWGDYLEGWKNKGTNMFLLKQFSSRINTSGKIMSAAAILLTLSMSAMALGLFMGAGYKENIEQYAPYDIAVKIDADISDFQEELRYVGEKVKISDYVDYKIYEDGIMENLPILALSDYNHIRKQLELKPLKLFDNEYAVHCADIYAGQAEEQIRSKSLITVGNYDLSSDESMIQTEAMEEYWMTGDNGYAIVVPDAVVRNLTTQKSRLIISTETPAPKELRDELIPIISSHLKPLILNGSISAHTEIGVLVQTWTAANSLTGYTIFSFSSLYIGIIFIVLVGTLMGFQQLAVAEANRRKYEILRKIGVSKKEMDGLLIKEMLLFFGTPVIMPLIVTIVLAFMLNEILREQISAMNLIRNYTLLAIGVFMIIYAVYFTIIFFSYRKLVVGRQKRK